MFYWYTYINDLLFYWWNVGSWTFYDYFIEIVLLASRVYKLDFVRHGSMDEDLLLDSVEYGRSVCST